MKKRLKLAVVAAFAISTMTISGLAADFTHCAGNLNAAGLFQGTNQGYELDRAPTRAEAGVMLVRLLGKEKAAQSLTYTAPYTDLDNWQKPYVQYLYENGLTTGTGKTTYSPKASCSAQMYSTFLLRALGYSEDAGDFAYKDAIAYAKTVGVANTVNLNEANFLRDHAVAMSYTALNVSTKDTQTKLLAKLLEEGAVRGEFAESMLDMFKVYDRYCESVQKRGTVQGFTANIDATLRLLKGEETVEVMDLPSKLQARLDYTTPSKSKIAILGAADGKQATNKYGFQQYADFAYYYQDGMAYCKMQGETAKQPFALSLPAEQGPYPLVLTTGVGETDNVFTLFCNDAAYKSLMNVLISAANPQFANAPITFFNVMLMVENGTVKSVHMQMKKDVVVDGVAMTLTGLVEMDVTATQDTITVDFPSDLNSY